MRLTVNPALGMVSWRASISDLSQVHTLELSWRLGGANAVAQSGCLNKRVYNLHYIGISLWSGAEADKQKVQVG